MPQVSSQLRDSQSSQSELAAGIEAFWDPDGDALARASSKGPEGHHDLRLLASPKRAGMLGSTQDQPREVDLSGEGAPNQGLLNQLILSPRLRQAANAGGAVLQAVSDRVAASLHPLPSDNCATARGLTSSSRAGFSSFYHLMFKAFLPARSPDAVGQERAAEGHDHGHLRPAAAAAGQQQLLVQEVAGALPQGWEVVEVEDDLCPGPATAGAAAADRAACLGPHSELESHLDPSGVCLHPVALPSATNSSLNGCSSSSNISSSSSSSSSGSSSSSSSSQQQQQPQHLTTRLHLPASLKQQLLTQGYHLIRIVVSTTQHTAGAPEPEAGGTGLLPVLAAADQTWQLTPGRAGEGEELHLPLNLQGVGFRDHPVAQALSAVMLVGTLQGEAPNAAAGPAGCSSSSIPSEPATGSSSSSNSSGWGPALSGGVVEERIVTHLPLLLLPAAACHELQGLVNAATEGGMEEGQAYQLLLQPLLQDCAFVLGSVGPGGGPVPKDMVKNVIRSLDDYFSHNVMPECRRALARSAAMGLGQKMMSVGT